MNRRQASTLSFPLLVLALSSMMSLAACGEDPVVPDAGGCQAGQGCTCFNNTDCPIFEFCVDNVCSPAGGGGDDAEEVGSDVTPDLDAGEDPGDDLEVPDREDDPGESDLPSDLDVDDEDSPVTDPPLEVSDDEMRDPVDDTDTDEPVNPYNPWVAYIRIDASTGASLLEFIRADGTGAQPFESSANSHFSPAWSPDGTKLAIRSLIGGVGIRIQIIDFSAGEVETVATDLSSVASPSWHPNDNVLVVEGHTADDTGNRINILELDDGSFDELTDGPNDSSPLFAADANGIFYVRTAGTSEIYFVASAGGSSSPVTTGSNLNGRVAMSPDGQYLVYERISTSIDLARFEISSSSIVGTVGARNDQQPSFFRDGELLAVVRPIGERKQIAVVETNGGRIVTQLTDSPSDNHAQPAVSPVDSSVIDIASYKD